MTMTIQTISEVDNTIFESLYSDSLDDIVSGSLDLPDDMSDDDKFLNKLENHQNVLKKEQDILNKLMK